MRAELPDAESFANVIVTNEDIVRIPYVFSNREGDMKILIDEITSQLERTTVWFMSQLDELGGT